MADLCWVCQERNQYAVHMREGDEEQALVQANIAVEEHMQHLRNAFDEHNYYKRQCEKAREDARRVIDGFEKRLPCSFDGVAHYSWDYAQQTHYPLNPLQPGPIYFKTPRKCGIFGVCNDGINLQYNYLIDEINNTGKGANATISYVHHFLETYGLGEKKGLFHADNCTGIYIFSV